MTGYLLRRLLACLPTLLGITLVAFIILSLLPTDPLLTLSEGSVPASAEATRRLREALGPQTGPVERYGAWLLGLARLALCTSLRDGRPVNAILAETLPWTLTLNLSAVLAIYVIGIPLGWLGTRRRGIVAAVGRAALLVLSILPPFAAAILLQRIFAVRLAILPLQGTGEGDATGLRALAETGRHLVLPTVCLAFAGWAYAARYARAAFRTVVTPGAVATARARGLHGLSLARHFAPNAALPFVWMVAGIVPALVSGSVIVEEAFSWPGIGRQLLRGVEGRDYPLVLAVVLLSALAVLMGQLLADFLLPAIDPRIRDAVMREDDVRG